VGSVAMDFAQRSGSYPQTANSLRFEARESVFDSIEEAFRRR
jgi:hypothetical protein